MAKPISCELYNCIPHVEKQRDALEHSTFTSVWHEIFQVFVNHKAQNDFGIALLHRHLHLPFGYAMVHSWDQLDRDICRQELLGLREIYPSSYCIRNGRLLAYEFASYRTPTPSTAFLQETTELLQALKLEDVIAITHINDCDHAWTETMLADCTGTVAAKSNQKTSSSSGDYIITEWAFGLETGTPYMVALRACERQENGGHART